MPDPTAHASPRPDDPGEVTPEQVLQLQTALAEQHRKLDATDPAPGSDERAVLANAICTTTEQLLAAEDRLRDRLRQQARQRRNASATRWALVTAALAAVAALPAAFGWPDRAWLIPIVALAIVALVVAVFASADDVAAEVDGPHIPFARLAHAQFTAGAAAGIAVAMLARISPLWGVAIVVLAAFARPACTGLAKEVLAKGAKARATTATTGAGRAAREGARL